MAKYRIFNRIREAANNNNGNGSANYYKLSDYGSFAAAVTDIGGTYAILDIDTAGTVDSAVTIPATLTLKSQGALLTKSESGTLTFEGIGLDDPESQRPLFASFSAGNITWSGTAPTRLSSNLWSDATVSACLLNAIGAVANKQTTIVAYPGEIAAAITLTEGLSLHLTKGTYTNTVAGSNNYTFTLEDNTRLYGDGQGQTFVEENANSVRIAYASGFTAYPFAGVNQNIAVEDITFVGNPLTGVDSSGSCVALGNCVNGAVRRCTFDRTHGFAAFVGGFTTTGNEAKNCFLTDNTCIGLQTQNMGTVGGRNIFIARNLFIVSPPSGAAFIACIDIEPNADTDGSDNVQIVDNILDGRMADSGWNGITVQRAYSGYMRHIRVAGNLIIGTDSAVKTVTSSNISTANDTFTLPGHGFQTGQPISITRDDNGNGGAIPTGLGATPFSGYAIKVDEDVFKVATTQANAVAGTAVDITDALSSRFVVTGGRRLANGIQFWQVENGIVENNRTIGGGQSGIDVAGCYGAIVQNNTITSHGGGGLNAFTVQTTVNSIIRDNYVNTLNGFGSQSDALVETDGTLTVSTTSGSPTVTVTTDTNLSWWHRGLTITIDAVDYVIEAASGTTLILTSNAASTLNGVTATVKYSSNKYIDNYAGSISLATTGSSEIIASAQKITNVADTAHTATTGDGIIVYTSLSAGRTVTLPAANTCKGKELVIKDGSGAAATHNITIDGNASETIDGATTYVISTNYGKVRIKSNGTGWITL